MATHEAKKLAVQLHNTADSKIRTFIQEIIRRIDIEPGKLSIMLDGDALRLRLTGDGLAHSRKASSATATLTLPFRLRRRGIEAKLVLNNQSQPSPSIDTKLVDTIRLAHRWLGLLTAGDVSSVDEIGDTEDVLASEVSRTLPLAFLAPDITKAILTGHQPIDMTAESLRRTKLPACWMAQRTLLRMPLN